MTERIDGHPYLRDGIIAYIGNKRRLLGLIDEAVNAVAGPKVASLKFADIFAGSGVVSRYARLRGMQVHANDWEPYSRILLRAWLESRSEDEEILFGGPGALSETVDRMNRLEAPAEDQQYLARYYAPSQMDPEKADYRGERLFYTRENALRLDAARNFVERETPIDDRETGGLRHCLLLAPILYAAATQVNTSGVFKAYHKGFGGHGKDALGRILKPIIFAPPMLLDAPRARVSSGDANELARNGDFNTADLVYLDPPYNQHQYGSNYHLLNTIVKWDRIPEPLEKNPDGSLIRKAGIRRDWTDTRSDYCYRKSAGDAFRDLLSHLSADYVLLSYSTDGIIPFDELRRHCESYGRLRMIDRPYITYRGGRQSVGRRDGNVEFVMMLERGKPTRSEDRDGLDRLLMRRRLDMLFQETYYPALLSESGDFRDRSWAPAIPGADLEIPIKYGIRLSSPPEIDGLDSRQARQLIDILENARCPNRDEELAVLQVVWADNPGSCRDIIKEIPRILRKTAHKKYRESFNKRLGALREQGRRFPEDFALIEDELTSIENLALRRFNG